MSLTGVAGAAGDSAARTHYRNGYSVGHRGHQGRTEGGCGRSNSATPIFRTQASWCSRSAVRWGCRTASRLAVISAVNRQLDPNSPMVYLQTDAAINPGNSGGPLVDMQGDLIGVNSMIESHSGGNEGLGFSIPSNTAKIIYEQIIKYGHARRGSIGIYPTNLTPTLAKGLGLSRESGVLIEDIVPDSAAARADLEIGEILVSLNDQPLRDTRQLAAQMFRESPGGRDSSRSAERHGDREGRYHDHGVEERCGEPDRSLEGGPVCHSAIGRSGGAD